SRVRLLAIAGAVAGAWTAAGYLANPVNFSRELHAASIPLVAHPVDLWWLLAHLRRAPGVTPASLPPKLVSSYARELAVLLAFPLSLVLARRRGRTTEDWLALLALCFLLRCMVDLTN